MAKTRLNNTHRSLMRALLDRKIVWNEGQLEEKEIFRKEISRQLRQISLKEVPESDLKVLRKYDQVTSGERIGIRSTEHDYNSKVIFEASFSFELPRNHDAWKWCGWFLGKENQNVTDAIFSYLDRIKRINQDITELKRNYVILIDDSKYYEDVYAVWKEVEEIRDQICQACVSLTRVNNSVVETIKHDMNRRGVS